MNSSQITNTFNESDNFQETNHSSQQIITSTPRSRARPDLNQTNIHSPNEQEDIPPVSRFLQISIPTPITRERPDLNQTNIHSEIEEEDISVSILYKICELVVKNLYVKVAAAKRKI